MNKLVNRLIGVLVLVLVLSSCGETPQYTKAYSFKNNTWTQEEKPIFVVDIPDTTNYYTVEITLRTTTDYAYNNLWFFIHTKTPKGQTGREPVQIKIAATDGSWVGEKSGTVVSTSVYYRHKRFPEKGKYVFTLEQGVTEDAIGNIMDISYTVTKDKSDGN